MNEEIKKTETPGEEKTTSSNNKGSQSKTASLVESANSAAERLAQENDRMEANIAKLNEANAIEKLSGRAQYQQPEKPKEMTDKEYADAFKKGELKFKD